MRRIDELEKTKWYAIDSDQTKLLALVVSPPGRPNPLTSTGQSFIPTSFYGLVSPHAGEGKKYQRVDVLGG